MKDFVTSHVYGLIVVYVTAQLVALWFFVTRVPEWIRSLRAAAWPMSQGTIDIAEVKTFGDQAVAELGYSYVVRGERYAGYYSRQFADEQHAWDYLKGLTGQLVVVRYKDTDPNASALRACDQQSYVKLAGPGYLSSFLRAAFERLTEFYPRRL